MRQGALILSSLAVLLAATPALSANAPLRTSERNKVPACAAPERLMQFVVERNARLDPRFAEVAKLYESHGRRLEVRWDYAFFQMLVETANLTFEKRGDAKPHQNNFAGIRTVGGGESDRFADIATGVQAHLHHIRMYSGDPVSSPAAKRTKDVERFIVPWAKGLGRPVTFEDMTKKWSPSDTGYFAAIEQVAETYRGKHCAGAAEVAESRAPEPAKEAAAAADPPQADKGGREERQAKGKNGKRNKTADKGQSERTATAKAEETAQAAGATTGSIGSNVPSQTTVASAAGAAAATGAARGSQTDANANADKPDPGANATCKVWSASFGGDKSVLIRMSDGQVTHFTALQVHAGREKEETNAYIAAYARGGKAVGEFASAEQAINKAFELCPKT
jgi:hypothetical protein